MITETVSTEQLQEQMDRLESKLDQVLQYTQDLEHRVEGLSEFKEDVVPILNDAGKLASHKLMQLEASGTLDTVRDLVSALTDPAMLRTLARASRALNQAREENQKAGLFRALRDADARRGMAVMMAVLRELGAEHDENQDLSRALSARGSTT